MTVVEKTQQQIDNLTKYELAEIFAYVCSAVVSAAIMREAIDKLKEPNTIGDFEELQAWFEED